LPAGLGETCLSPAGPPTRLFPLMSVFIIVVVVGVFRILFFYYCSWCASGIIAHALEIYSATAKIWLILSIFLYFPMNYFCIAAVV
jgi:hypothetical protein